MTTASSTKASAIEQHRRITRARARLLVHLPFWGHLALNLEPKDMPGDLAMGTMATDGTRLFYDSEGKMCEWTDEQLMGAVVHEVGHCAFGHIWRKENREQFKWNLATDFAINWLITQEQVLELPPGCLVDKQFANMSAEEIYSKIQVQKMEISGASLDDPDIWKNTTEGKGSGEGDDKDEKDDENEDGGGSGDKEDDKQDGGGAQDKFKSAAQQQQNEQYWKDKIVQAAQAAKMQGKLPSHLAYLVESLLEPKLDWKELLREYIVASVRNDYKIMPPNKRFIWMPLYLPSLQGEHIELVAAIDTSGSISNALAQQFISEIKGIAAQFSSYVIHYIQCDAKVQSYQELTIEDQDDWPLEVHGRGGTSFIPVFEKVEELGITPPILVYLTDLMGSFPEEPNYPVLWVSSCDGHIPFGDKILIEGNRGY